MMDPADRAMLNSVQQALTDRVFADPVFVAGNWMPRRLARQIERNLLRLRVAERRQPLDDAGGQHTDALTFMPAVRSFHASGDTRVRQ